VHTPTRALKIQRERKRRERGGEAQRISWYVSYIYAIHKIHALTQAYKNAYVQTYMHRYPEGEEVQSGMGLICVQYMYAYTNT